MVRRISDGQKENILVNKLDNHLRTVKQCFEYSLPGQESLMYIRKRVGPRIEPA